MHNTVKQGIMNFGFNGSAVRTISLDGKEYFVAKDIAELLGYADTDQAIRKHCKNAVTANNFSPVILTGSLDSRLKLILEPDVWRLVIKSKLPKAEKIETWIMEEVLPSIRKNGYYLKENLTEEQEIKLVTEVKHKYDRRYIDLSRRQLIEDITQWLVEDGYTSSQAQALISSHYNTLHATIMNRTATKIIYDAVKDNTISNIQSYNTLRKSTSIYALDFASAINFYNKEQLEEFGMLFEMILTSAKAVINNPRVKPTALRVREEIDTTARHILKVHSGLSNGTILQGINREELNKAVTNMYNSGFILSEQEKDIVLNELLSFRHKNFTVKY